MLEPILTVKRADEAMSTYERVIPWFCFIPSKLSLKKQRHVNFRCREFDHCLGALSPSLCYHVIAEILWCDVLFSNVTLVVLGPRTWGNGRWYSYTALGGNILSKEKIVHSADIANHLTQPSEESFWSETLTLHTGRISRWHWRSLSSSVAELMLFSSSHLSFRGFTHGNAGSIPSPSQDKRVNLNHGSRSEVELWGASK